MSIEAMKQALEAMEKLWDIIDDIDTYGDMAKSDDKLYRSLVERRQRQRFEQTGISTDGYELNGGAITALRQALAQPEQEQKTPLKVLNLTVFTENRLRNGRVYDVETLQAMTSRDILAIPDMGKKALKEVMEALDVYAVNMSQERVDETAKDRHIPDGTIPISNGGIATRTPTDFFSPPKRQWVGLSDEEIQAERHKLDTTAGWTYNHFARAIEAKLEEKNGG